MASSDELLGIALATSSNAFRALIENEVKKESEHLCDSLAAHFTETFVRCFCHMTQSGMSLSEINETAHLRVEEQVCWGHDADKLIELSPRSPKSPKLHGSSCSGRVKSTRASTSASVHAVPSKDQTPTNEDSTDCDDKDLMMLSSPSENHTIHDSCRKKSSFSLTSKRPSVSSLSNMPRWRAFGAHLVWSREFEGFFNCLIIFNCVTLGYQAEEIVNGPLFMPASVMDIMDHALVGLFTAELMIRVAVFGPSDFFPWRPHGHIWFFCDALIVVVTGPLSTWLIPAVAYLFEFDTENDLLRTFAVFRVLRLFRIVRAVQRVPQFHEAWLLVRGLMQSTRTLFWTCVVICFITYLFAVFGLQIMTTQLIDTRDAAVDLERKYECEKLLEFVGSLDRLMYTLIQLLTLDSWNAIVRRLVDQVPWCWVFFYMYIGVNVFVLMNLVTSIMVENAVTNSRHDEEAELKDKEKAKLADIQTLENLFESMDTDGSNTLSWNEFREAFHDCELRKKWKLLDFDPEECKELFSLLDDGDGEIEIHEFFTGLTRMKGVAMSKDIFRLQKKLESMQAPRKDTSNCSSPVGESCFNTNHCEGLLSSVQAYLKDLAMNGACQEDSVQSYQECKLNSPLIPASSNHGPRIATSSNECLGCTVEQILPCVARSEPDRSGGIFNI